MVRNIENIKQYRQGRMTTVLWKIKWGASARVHHYALMTTPLHVFSYGHSYDIYIWGVGKAKTKAKDLSLKAKEQKMFLRTP